MPRSRFIVGIDLGTTNCAVAYVDTKGRERPAADIQIFEVPQLVAAGETAGRAMLPSFLYLPGAHELPAGATALPWREENDRIVGEFARDQGARVPTHLVSSAKSWLCHGGVDREAAILPWQAPGEARKVSPVEASSEYLKHIRDAWNWHFGREDEAHALERQEVVLTVPASFDEAARELTVSTARQAGLTHLTLLEEPQAAFYCWIVTHQDGWQSQVRAGELILVCDIGGGTTDFSLISVVETPTGPGFRRVAVGDHLLLGGDNMDLALAHHVETKLGRARLDVEQWSALRFACRTAKEKLLDNTADHARWPVTIAGRGSKLIGGSIQAELVSDDVNTLVLDGFFPACGLDEPLARATKSGLQEFGLPYVSDPAITKHLSAFLRAHASEANAPSAQPDGIVRASRPEAILFNGGALTPTIVRTRLTDTVAGWFRAPDQPDWRPRVLANESLDLAVAMGAAYYGVVRRGGGIRIGGGTARSMSVGIQSDLATPKESWLCVVPRDAQEGDAFEIAGHDFELLMGQHVSFPLASSSVRASDRAGDLLETADDSMRALPPLVGFMKVGRKAKADRVPIALVSRLTEVGTVELWCRSKTDERRWQLQIQLRGPEGKAQASTSASVSGRETDVVVLEQAVVDSAVSAIEVAFTPGTAPEQGPSRLLKNLESLIESPKDQWPPNALRAMWEPLREAADKRARSPQHESRWLNLAGFCLRPGTGYPLDDARLKALWAQWNLGVQNPKDMQCWVEWWILWRRVAAGLNRARHEEIHRRLLPFLLPAKGSTAAKKGGRLKPEPHELSEMWRCACSLERLTTDAKQALGRALVDNLRDKRVSSHALWCLGRLGARVLLYGPLNTVVPAAVATEWVESLLGFEPETPRELKDLCLALEQLARVSSDRARDLDDAPRARVIDRLGALGADPDAIEVVRSHRELASSAESEAFGDSLPIGLRLVRSESGE